MLDVSAEGNSVSFSLALWDILTDYKIWSSIVSLAGIVRLSQTSSNTLTGRTANKRLINFATCFKNMAVYSRRKIINVNVCLTIYLCCYAANIFLDAEKSWSLCRQK
mgnify:CR=1